MIKLLQLSLVFWKRCWWTYLDHILRTVPAIAGSFSSLIVSPVLDMSGFCVTRTTLCLISILSVSLLLGNTPISLSTISPLFVWMGDSGGEFPAICDYANLHGVRVLPTGRANPNGNNNALAETSTKVVCQKMRASLHAIANCLILIGPRPFSIPLKQPIVCVPLVCPIRFPLMSPGTVISLPYVIFGLLAHLAMRMNLGNVGLGSCPTGAFTI